MKIVKLLAVAVAVTVFLDGTSIAGTYTWMNASSGGWGTAGNWDTSPTFDSSAILNFNTLNLTADIAMTLDADRTVNQLIFGDTDTGTLGGWSVSGNILTLSGTAPTVTVNSLGSGKFVAISSTIAGTGGFTKNGSGVLALTGANGNSGTILVTAGTLRANRGTGWATTANLNLQGGILEVSSSFTATLGTGAGQVQMTASKSGFSAFGGSATISFGNTAIGYCNSGSAGRIQILNGPTADSTLTFATPFTSNVRGYIQVDSAIAVLSKLWTSGGSNVVQAKFGAGTLQLDAGWTVGGSAHPHVSQGTLVVNNVALSVVNTEIVFIGTDHTANGAPAGVTSATLTIQGASATATAQSICVGNTVGYAGVLNLDGGITSVQKVYKGGGTGTVFLNGGTLRTLDSTDPGNFLTGLTATYIKSGGATFDSNGIDTTVGQNLLTDAVSTGGGLIKKGSGKLTLTGNNTYTGLTDVQVGTLSLGRTGGTIANGAAVQVSGGILDVANSDTVGAVTLVNGTISGAGTLTGASYAVRKGAISATLGGSGALTKTTADTVTLSGVHTYSGSTTITDGSLVVNGSINNSAVTVNAGSLSGSGSVKSIAGAGLINPGNSPGILTAESLDPSSGTDFAFEFTQTGSPTYGTATASGNDVLRLTAADPFTASLASGNTVNVYFNAGTLAKAQVFKGGFYADNGGASALLTDVKDGTFAYFVADAAGALTFNSVNYMTLAAYNAAKATTWSVTVGTVAETANFGSGDVTGSTMVLTVVPEPATAGMLLIGLAGVALRRRQKVQQA